MVTTLEVREPMPGEAVPTRRRPPAKTKAIDWHLLAWRLGALAALIVAWQVVYLLGLLTPTLSKSPVQVWDFLLASATSGELWMNFYATAEATVIAFALAAVVGTAFGVILGLLPRLSRVLAPLLDGLNAMPRVALVPLAIVVFGITMQAKVAVAFSVAVFITLFAASSGIRSADPDVVQLTRVLGAGKEQLVRFVLLPVAVPSIFSGLRLALTFSLLGVVSSEIVAAEDGLGQLVAMYSGQFRMEAVYGILIVLAVFGAALNGFMAFVESRILQWQSPDVRGNA